MSHILSAPVRWLGIFVLLVGLTALLFTRLPGSFLPAEDRGYVISIVQAPPGATLERTEEAIRQMKAYYAQQPEVSHYVLIRGFSFFGQGQNAR